MFTLMFFISRRKNTVFVFLQKEYQDHAPKSKYLLLNVKIKDTALTIMWCIATNDRSISMLPICRGEMIRDKIMMVNEVFSYIYIWRCIYVHIHTYIPCSFCHCMIDN